MSSRAGAVRTALLVIEVLAILPAIGLAVASGLLFDAPGSENNPYNWMIVDGLVAYPFFTVASLVAGRFVRSGSAWSWACVVLPGAPVLVGIAGVVLDVTVCGGNLACRHAGR
jgi:hypothetical protein